MITEQEASRLLHEAVDGLEPAPGGLGAVRAGHARRQRRRWLPVGVGLAAAAAAVAVVVALAGTSSPKSQSLKVLAPPAVNGWTPIVASAGPAGTVTVYTGKEFVAAGVCCSTDVAQDLHAYNPVTRRWRDLPRTPLSPRGTPVGIWTGTRIIVAGGDGPVPSGGLAQLRDGAAFDPATGKWHAIAAAPDGFSSQNASAVWTGKEMLVWRSGGSVSGISDERVMAYNPGTDTWRELPPSGLSLRSAPAVVFTGGRLFVWGGFQAEHFEVRLSDGAVLDLASGRWTPVAAAPIPGRASPATASTAAGVFVWGGDGPNGAGFADGALYDPAANSWRVLPASPVASSGVAKATRIGRNVFVVGQRSTAPGGLSTGEFDPTTFTWRSVTAPPDTDGGTEMVHSLEFVGWTGTDVLVVQQSAPIQDNVSNVADYRLDGFAWHPTSSATGVAAATTEPPPTSVPPTTAPDARPVTRLYTCTNTIEFEPSDYVLACADYGMRLTNLHWTSWTASSAETTGDWYQNDCDPDCASGHFHTYPASRIVFDEAKTAPRGVFFNRVTVTFAGATPNGRQVEVFEPLLPQGGHW